MSVAVDGFLSESLDHVRSHVREKYAAWCGLLMRVNQLALANQHAIVIHTDSNVERYSAVLFARTLATTQASTLLLEAGLVSQARVLLRSALETLFALAAIAKDANIVEKLIEGHFAEQKRFAKNAQLWQDDELKKIAEAETVSGQLQSVLNSSATALSTFDLAQKAGLEDWYRTVYMVFSWPVHGAAVDLNRHVVISGDGNVEAFRNEPEVDDQESLWLCGIEVLLKAIAALATTFPNVDQGSMEQYYVEARNLESTIAR
jgi:hypothetical protein